jgi:hypothetical protein
LQVCPRGILLGPVPVVRKRSLAQQCSLENQRSGLLVKDGHQGPTCAWQLDILGQPDRASLINDRFDSFNHRSILPLNQQERASEKWKFFGASLDLRTKSTETRPDGTVPSPERPGKTRKKTRKRTGIILGPGKGQA